MTKNKILLGIASAVALLLLIPALLLPTMGATATLSATNFSFDDQKIGISGTNLQTALGGRTDLKYPSTATIVPNPADPTNTSDRVLRLDSKTVATGTVPDFYVDGVYAYTITWTDSAKTSGTATNGTNPYNVTSTDGGKTVVSSKNNNIYTVYNDAATKEAVGSGLNVDQKVTVGNVAMSYNDYDKIVLQAEYYIESGSKGTFESQICKYSSTTHNTTSYLDLFRVDLSSGVLTTGYVLKDGKQGTCWLEKDVWNTVSLVIDLDTGAVDFYVNNLLLIEGYFVRDGVVLKGLIFNKDNWSIAKIMKQSIGAAGLAGSLYVNNARYHSYSESTKVTLPQNDNLLYADVTLASGREVGASPSDTILQNTGVTYKLVTTDEYQNALTPVEGASIRLNNTTGIRFATQVNTSKINALLEEKAAGKIRNVQIGTLITPYTYVTEAGAFTVDALSKLSYSAKYLDVKATVGEYYNPGVTLDEGYDTCFVGSIIDIKPGNRTRLFTAVGYIKITLNNGAVKYIYSYDYTDATTQEKNYSRSIRSVAERFVNDSNYVAYREILQSFMGGLTVATDYSTAYVNNVQYSYNEFYFQNAAGVACRLVYDGNNGWRLQAVKPTQTNSKYNEFNNMGAAQALSHYLGENCEAKAVKLTVSQDTFTFTIRAEGTDSYVTLDITGGFNLQFFSPEDVLMNNVNSISASDTNVTMTGKLNSGEAVYGGGETFTSANKRGQYMSLYSYDAYNAGNPDGKNLNGTYAVIPLFTFTRGSGLFVNRYEVMTADWGNTSKGNGSSDVWEISIDNDLIDCYFYATGNMLDAIYGYTDLAGHATLPEEWAQGTLICRYSPDFTKLNGEQVVFQSLEELPDYATLLLSANGAKVTTNTDAAKVAGAVLYSGAYAQYVCVDYDLDGDLEYVRTSRKGNSAPMGWGVKAIVDNLIAAGMKPTAMILEGLNWMNISTTANYQNFIECISYCEDLGINTMVYWQAGNLDSRMPGYKEEYQLHANVTYDLKYENGKQDWLGYTYTHGYEGGSQSTIKIPKSEASDNPDAAGSGTTNYLDITNPEAVDWYIDVVWGQLIELGVDGAKIDFCEILPNEGLKYDLKGMMSNGSSSIEAKVGTATLNYYEWYDPTVFEGDDVHHAYPTYLISLLCQRLREKAPEGFAVINRGGGIGMQRNPFIWAGDQTREEITLTTQLMAVLNSGISGLPFVTYDMAGYAYLKKADNGPYDYWNGNYTDPETGLATAQMIESEIYVRALQYTTFSLATQTNGDVRHAYEMTEEAQKIIVQYTNLRNDLMPYIRKYSKVACDTGMPVMRLLVLHYQNDANVYDINDQYMFGDGLMVAPILELNTTTRVVYLPEGNWVDLLTGEGYTVGAGGKTITVTAKLDQIPVFLNRDSKYADYLSGVFNRTTWQEINGGIQIPYVDFVPEEPDPADPTEDDLLWKEY